METLRLQSWVHKSNLNEPKKDRNNHPDTDTSSLTSNSGYKVEARVGRFKEGKQKDMEPVGEAEEE